MSRSSGGSLGKMMEDLRTRARQRTLDNDPLFQRASGQGAPAGTSDRRPGNFSGRILRHKGILNHA